MANRRRAMDGVLTNTQIIFLRALGLAVTHGSKVALVDGHLRVVDSKGRVFPIPTGQVAEAQELWMQGAAITHQVVID